jgi:membrane associated rhomboid family serine protease
MFRSIIDDVKRAFETGNMVTRIVILNVVIYMITALLEAFMPETAGTVLSWLAVPGEPIKLLTRPWTLITHMFIHSGFWHMGWNMLMFYWFGTITGDLLGDKRILPVYILGGLIGAVAYILSYQLVPGIGYMALGASAAVLALVFAAVATAPDYNMRLLLIGDVKIKFIGLFILFFDLIGIKSGYNSGGHIAHIGGSLFGMAYVYLLRQGTDLSSYVNAVISIFTQNQKPSRTKSKSKLRVEHKAENIRPKTDKNKLQIERQVIIDKILDKIRVSGYDSLSEEEKETLFQASKES